MSATETADGKLGDVLRGYAVAKFSGALRVDGQPGGTIHLVGGGISGCETSGAPSLEVILLRSGRVAESDWNAAFSSSAIAERPMTAELVERDLLGAGEVEALLRIALADAMFALTCGRIDGWTETAAADCPLPLDPVAKAGWLLAEATRRRQALAAFPAPLVSATDRIAVAHGTAPPGRVLGHGQDEILAMIDGRRTPRDLAFALGRGLYETMLQLTRMRASNAVVISVQGNASASPGAGLTSGDAEHDQTANGLPRRRRDRPSSSRSGESSRRSFTANIRSLLPRSEETTMPD